MQRFLQAHPTHFRVARVLLGAGLIGSLVACGGGSPASSDAPIAAAGAPDMQGAAPAAPANVFAATVLPVANAETTWTQCAWEGETCKVSGTQQVRYGANGSYLYKTVTDAILCANTVWGDPAAGARKACEVASAAPTAPPPATVTWTQCAWEGQTCTVSGTQQVRYGANGAYFYKTVTGPIACANATWGDPAPGVRKSCDVSSGSTTTPPPTTPPPTTPPPAGSVLPIPTNVASGTTVSLQCGTTYQGTLELNGKTNVTVKTAGTCGKAIITPGRRITGWVKGTGSIYSAPISFNPVQVSVGGAFVSAAHWPNQPWATSTSGMPSSDLAGATHVFLANQSVIQSQVLTGNSVSTAKPFYVEGKLWMLDTPGEWAVSNGRLYLWSPDGTNPEGKAWASANGNGVNADNSSGITLDGIKIFGATDGVSANTSTNLKVLNTDIANSARDGIWASGSKGLQVNLSNVTNTRRNGIDGWYSVNGAIITNTTVSNTGTVGMPSTTDAGIMFGDGGTNTIDNVRVTNSGYHGISVLHNRNTAVKNSVVDKACVHLHDCGGIYTGARDQLPLTLLIENNTVTNVNGSENVGIYLDDHANGVTINKNRVSNTTRAIFLHNGFNTVITYNTLAASEVAHLQFSQDSGTIRNNKVSNNTFNSTRGEFTYNTEAGSNLKTFMSADYNTYTSSNVNVFHRYWDGRSAGVTQSYTGWKAWGGQDAHSTMNGR